MNNNVLIGVVFMISFFFKTISFAQVNDRNLISISKSFNEIVNKVQSFRNNHDAERTVAYQDSLEKINIILTKYLLTHLKQKSESTNIDKYLNESIVTKSVSEDNKLNLFIWNSQMGGTQEQYVVIAQYKTSNDNYTTVLLNSIDSESDTFNYLYDKIHVISINKVTYYMIVGSQKHNPFIVQKSLQILNVNKSEIGSGNAIIKDMKGRLYNKLFFQYDINDTKKEPEFYIDVKRGKIGLPNINNGGFKFFSLLN
jgi:hypothetical protein